MISIAYQTEFTNCKRLLSIYGNVGGTACVRLRNMSTGEVVKEVSDIGIDDAQELYEKLLNLLVKCENCEKPCFTR